MNHKTPIGTFASIHAPASGVATITVAAPGAGRRLVITAVHGSQAAGSSAPTAAGVKLSLINGASGGSDVRWVGRTGATAVAGQSSAVSQSGLWVEMDENTAATLEFSAAITNAVECVSISGLIMPL